jgi:hypothetical protein
MRFVKPMILVGLVVGATACGTKSNSSDTQPVAADVNAALVPAAAIIRVPVDASGNPTGEPSMRTVNADKASLSTPEALSAAFEAGAEPQKIVANKSELDGDTSTQSWCGWGRGGLGYGYGYGYYGGYGAGYWGGSYSPTLWWGGASYGYGYGGFGGIGGYNYYSYNRY